MKNFIVIPTLLLLSSIYVFSQNFNIKEISLDFGKLCQGDDSTLYIFIKNTGNLDDSLRRPLDNSAFTVIFPDSSDIFKIKKGDSTRISIKFKPIKIGNQEDTLYICSYTYTDTIKLFVKGICVNTGISLDTKSISAILQTNVPFKKKINVKSTGTEDILVDIIMYPQLNNILFGIEPEVPKLLTYMQNQEFELTFTMLTDSVYLDGIFVGWSGKCFGGTYIALDLQSISSKIEFADKNEIFICFPNPSADKIQIRINNPNPCNITLSLYDLFGREIETIYSDFAVQNFNLEYDLKNILSGTYFLVMTTGAERQVCRIEVIK